MGILGNYRESCTIVNRTDRDLNVRYDGEDITLTPGRNTNFPKVAVPFAINQNPLKGSQHPLDPQKFISLIGVEGSKHWPVEPFETTALAEADAKLERMDRDGSTWDEPMAPVRLQKKKGFTAYEARANAGGFENNAKID